MATLFGPSAERESTIGFHSTPIIDKDDYEAIKVAVPPDTISMKKPTDGAFELPPEWKGRQIARYLHVRIMDLQMKWLKNCTTVEDVQEVLGIEQFLNTLKPEKKLWVMEHKPETCLKAGELADEYELARQQEPRVERVDSKKTYKDQENAVFAASWVTSRETAERRRMAKELMVL